MRKASDIVSNVKRWGEEQEAVRLLILVGSRADGKFVDDLADFDVQVFATDYEKYIHDNEWLSEIGNVWICVQDEYDDVGEVGPTRLVIYEGGFKIDFAFYTMRMLPRKKWTETLQVLLDKDGVTATIQPPTRNNHGTLPTQQDFTRVAEEFWFEVYHVAKYLKRQELWLAKSRDWAAKILLLRMIEWNEQIRDGSNSQIYEDGRHMKSWISPDTWAELDKSFAHFDLVDSWQSLMGMTRLFRDLAIVTAVKLGFDGHIGLLQTPDKPAQSTYLPYLLQPD